VRGPRVGPGRKEVWIGCGGLLCTERTLSFLLFSAEAGSHQAGDTKAESVSLRFSAHGSRRSYACFTPALNWAERKPFGTIRTFIAKMLGD